MAAQHSIVTMPQTSGGANRGVVATWKKQPGERVSPGDVVATVKIGDTEMDVGVFATGYLAGPLAEVGTAVPAGGNLGYITDTPQELVISDDEIVTHHAPADLIPHDVGVPVLMPQLSDTMTEGAVVT